MSSQHVSRLSFSERSRREVDLDDGVLARARSSLAALSRILGLLASFSTVVAAQDPDSLLSAAVRQERTGDTRAAQSSLRTLLSRHPQHHDARVFYARLLSWDQRYDEALSQYDFILSADPGHPDARFGTAQVLAWMGRHDRSLKFVEQLVREDSASPSYVVLLANVQLWSGRSQEALASYERALQLDPTSLEILRGLARSSVQLGRSESALTWYQRVALLSPGDAEARAEVYRLTYQATHEVLLQGQNESFIETGRSSHQLLAFEYYAALDPVWKPYAHFSRVTRFSKTDTRFGIGAYVNPSFGTGIFLQGVISPNATVVPEFDISAELDRLLFRNLEGVAGYRYMEFDSSNVHIFSPGLTIYFGAASWITPRLYWSTSSSGSTSTSVVLTLFYQLGESSKVRLGGFAGAEAFRATTLREITESKSSGYLLGMKSRLHKLIATDAQYQFTRRENSSDAHQLTLTLSLLF